MRNRRGIAVAVGLGASLLLCAAAVARRPQGDITRVVPFLLAALLLWALVLGITFGPRWGAAVALAGGAVLLLAAGVYMVFVTPIDYAECQQLYLELSDDACRDQSDLGWAVLVGVGALCCGALGLLVGRRRQSTAH